MKQAYIPRAGKLLFRDIAVRQPGEDEVLLKVLHVGICGSDLHVFKGEHPLINYPLVLGHEFSGRIEEPGKNVTDLQSGDLVTVQPAVGCGRCRACLKGYFARCESLSFIGGNLPGGSSEYFTVSRRQVIKLPSGVSAADGAMTEPLTVAVHGINRLNLVKGKNILISGGGTIGNLIAQVCRSMGAGRTVIIEKNPYRCAIARQMGFSVLSGTIDINTLKDAFDGEDADAGFECSGSPGLLNLDIGYVKRGGELVVLAVYKGPVSTDMIYVQDKELTVKGSLMYQWEDFVKAQSLMEKKEVDLKSLQSHHFSFDRWSDAYDLLLRKPEETMKILIDL